ncbi:hypothetical protein [Micromonospora sp. SH-82]|uniref:hypothetical protein n=1 Tax=Micromonospora sp. SH-82 TaxID=3132938 RepID=UPI003EC0B121
MHSDDPFEQKPTEASPTDHPVDAPSPERTTGRHRRRSGTRRRPGLLASAPARVAIATGVCCCLGVAAFAGINAGTDRPTEPVREALLERDTEADQRASRALDRLTSPSPDTSATASPSPSASPTPKTSKSATAKPTPKKSTRPPRPRPVAGLTQTQMDNAKVIVDVGADMKMPRRAMVVALATAMQESNLYNLASDVIPESHQYSDQGSGSDHDSVGLFQQRPSSGWGTVRDLMRPAHSAQLFYEALRKIPAWEQMSVTAAAQAVQISAFPDKYAQHEQRATTVVSALL